MAGESYFMTFTPHCPFLFRAGDGHITRFLFGAGMSNVIEIVIKQSSSGNAIHDASKALGGLSGAAGGAIGSLGKFGGALGNMATIAGGIVAANLFGKIAEGISSFVTTGLNAVGSSQQLETSLKSLLTANNMYEQSTETVTQAVTNQIMSQDEYGQKLDELNAKLVTQRATYQEQQERIRQLTEQYGENGLVVIKNKAQHEQLAIAIRGTEQDIASLATTETKLSTSTETAWHQVMSQTEAMKIAKKETANLLEFVSRLAVVSPFETEDVEMTTKYAVAAGLGLDQTKQFVPAFLDLAASVGITSDSLGFAADQLFQVRKIGKLTEIDLRQLRRLGIDLGKIIGVEMGMSVSEFNEKAGESPEIFDELFDAVTRFSANTFAGTSKEMALSVKGLQSTISDVFVIGSRTFLRPLVDAFTPAIAGIVGKLSDFVLGGEMKSLGDDMAKTLMGGIAKFQKSGAGGLFASLGFEGGALFFKKLSKLMTMITGDAGTLAGTIKGVLGGAFGWLQSNMFPILSKGIQFVIDGFQTFRGVLLDVGTVVGDVVKKVTGAFERFGFRGAAISILGQLGLEPSQIATVLQTMDQMVSNVTGAIDKITGAFDRFGVRGAAVSILGILGLEPETIATVLSITDQIVSFVSSFVSQVGGFLGSLSFDEIIGAFTGIGIAVGAIVASGILTALVAGLMSLLTPINLIIVGAALLGAAWAGNWGGIQDKFFAAWAVIQPALQELWNWLGINIPIAIQTASDFWTNTLWPALQQVGAFIVGTVIPAMVGLWQWLSVNVPMAVQTLSDIWTNTLLPGFQRVWEAIQTNLLPLFQQLFTWLASEGPGIAQVLGDAWTNIILPALAAVGDFLLNTLFPAWVELQVWLAENIPVAIQILSDIWTNTLLPAITNAGTFITGTLIPTLTNLWTWLSTNIVSAIQTVSDIWTTIFMPAITGVWTFISTLVIPLFQSLTNLMGAVLVVALTALAGLWQNVLLPAIEVVSNFIGATLTVALNALIALVAQRLGPTIRVFAAIWQSVLLPGLTAVGNIVKSVVAPGLEDVGKKAGVIGPILQVLADVALKAVASGFDAIAGAIKSATNLFNTLADAVKNFKLPAVLQPGSPPPFAVALQDIANAAGMAANAMGGFSQATIDKLLGVNRAIASNRNTIGAARDDLEKFFDKSNIGGVKGNFALVHLSKIFKEHSAEILTATDRAAKFREIVSRVGPNWEKAMISGEQWKTVNAGIGLFINFFDKRKKELILAQQQMFVQAGKTALSIGMRLNDIVQASVDVLDMRVETLQGLVSSGMAEVNFQGMILSQAQAQELLNAALAEQLDIQDDIFQLKQNEQKLGFLEKQLDLIDTLNAAGLNVQDILGGITLGLDASIPDMIEATNRLVMAMIEQVNKDLQLGSPSKLMFKKFQLAGMGAVQGLLSMKPMLEKAIGPVIDPLMSAGNGAVSNRTTNNYFSQTVNTRAESSTVIGDFRTMQMLLGA